MPVIIAVLRNSIPAIISHDTDEELLTAIAAYPEIPDWAKLNMAQLREWLAAQDFPSGVFATIEEAKAYTKSPRICPECGYEFKGRGWDGIDAHWRARHDNIMPYEQAWPLIKARKYRALRAGAQSES